MEYLFRTVLALHDNTGAFEIFKDGEQFLCVCLWWKGYKINDRPAPVRIWKEKNKWQHNASNESIYKQLLESVIHWKINQKQA